MERQKKVIVMLKCGKTLEFSVSCYEDYKELIGVVNKVWHRWIGVGPTAYVKKDTIAGIFYVGEKCDWEETDSHDEV